MVSQWVPLILWPWEGTLCCQHKLRVSGSKLLQMVIGVGVSFDGLWHKRLRGWQGGKTLICCLVGQCSYKGR